MVDLAEASYDALYEVNKQYVESEKMEYALNLNSALKEVLRGVNYSMSDKEVEIKLRNAALSVSGRSSNSLRDKKVSESLEWFKDGKANDTRKVIETQIIQRSEQAHNSFMLGESPLKDVGSMADMVFSGAEKFMTPSRLEIAKQDFKSKATLYSLMLYKPDEVDELLTDPNIKNTLSTHDLAIVLRETQNERRRSQSIANSNQIPKITNDFLSGKIRTARDYDVRLATAGATSVETTNMFGELQAIRSMSYDQLMEGIQNESLSDAERRLYAQRLQSIRTDAGKNIAQYVYDSNLELPDIDYGSGGSLINRSAHVTAWAEQFNTPINSIFTSSEREDIKRIFAPEYSSTQVAFLSAVSAINEPKVYQAVLKDLDSFDPTARAKTIAVAINGPNLAEAFALSDRGLRTLKTSSSPGTTYSTVKRVLGEAFDYMGTETSDSVTELISGYLVAKGKHKSESGTREALKHLFNAELGHLGGVYIAGTEYYGSGRFARPLSPIKGRSPNVLLPPGMSQNQAAKAYDQELKSLYKAGYIAKQQYGGRVGKSTVLYQVYPVSLGVNQYGLMLPSINGNSVPLLDVEGIPVKISLPYN